MPSNFISRLLTFSRKSSKDLFDNGVLDIGDLAIMSNTMMKFVNFCGLLHKCWMTYGSLYAYEKQEADLWFKQ